MEPIKPGDFIRLTDVATATAVMFIILGALALATWLGVEHIRKDERTRIEAQLVTGQVIINGRVFDTVLNKKKTNSLSAD